MISNWAFDNLLRLAILKNSSDIDLQLSSVNELYEFSIMCLVYFPTGVVSAASFDPGFRGSMDLRWKSSCSLIIITQKCSVGNRWILLSMSKILPWVIFTITSLFESQIGIRWSTQISTCQKLNRLSLVLFRDTGANSEFFKKFCFFHAKTKKKKKRYFLKSGFTNSCSCIKKCS